QQDGPVLDASPSGSTISEFLDAFEGASLFYDPLSPNPAATDNQIWRIEAFADSFAVSPRAPRVEIRASSSEADLATPRRPHRTVIRCHGRSDFCSSGISSTA